MLELTINDILHGDWEMLDPNNEPFSIYMVREDDVVLYIGMSQDPFTRLYNHFSKYSGAALGTFYKQHRSKAGNWRICLYTLEDCRPYVQQHALLLSDVARVEVAMIQHFKPCLNVLNNSNPSLLPEKYANLATNEINSLDDNAVDYIKLDED